MNTGRIQWVATGWRCCGFQQPVGLTSLYVVDRMMEKIKVACTQDNDHASLLCLHTYLRSERGFHSTVAVVFCSLCNAPSQHELEAPWMLC